MLLCGFLLLLTGCIVIETPKFEDVAGDLNGKDFAIANQYRFIANRPAPRDTPLLARSPGQPPASPESVLQEFKALHRPILLGYCGYRATIWSPILPFHPVQSQYSLWRPILTDEASAFVRRHTYDELLLGIGPLLHDPYWSGDTVALLEGPRGEGSALADANYKSPDQPGNWPGYYEQYAKEMLGVTWSGGQWWIWDGQIKQLPHVEPTPLTPDDPYFQNRHGQDPRAQPLLQRPGTDPENYASQVRAEFLALPRPIIQRYVTYPPTPKLFGGYKEDGYTHIVLTDEACAFIQRHTFEELAVGLASTRTESLLRDPHWTGDAMAIFDVAAAGHEAGLWLAFTAYRSPDDQGRWPEYRKHVSELFFHASRPESHWYISNGFCCYRDLR